MGSVRPGKSPVSHARARFDPPRAECSRPDIFPGVTRPLMRAPEAVDPPPMHTLAWVVAVQLLSSAGPEAAGAGDRSVYALKPDEFAAQARRDLATLHHYEDGLRRLQQSLDQNASLFTRSETAPYTPEQKAILLSTWGAFFSYFVSIEGIRQRYLGFVKIPPTEAVRHLW